MRRWYHSISKAFLLFAFLLGTHTLWADTGGKGTEGPSPIILSVVLLAAILGMGGFALVWHYRYRYDGKAGFFRYAFRNPLVLLVIATLAIIGVVNAFAPKSLDRFPTPASRIRQAQTHARPGPLIPTASSPNSIPTSPNTIINTFLPITKPVIGPIPALS